jgi:hypothetical protein
LTLFLLIYTSPRSRQKLSGSSLLVLAMHFFIWASTAILLLRALITIGTTLQDLSAMCEDFRKKIIT